VLVWETSSVRATPGRNDHSYRRRCDSDGFVFRSHGVICLSWEQLDEKQKQQCETPRRRERKTASTKRAGWDDGSTGRSDVKRSSATIDQRDIKDENSVV